MRYRGGWALNCLRFLLDSAFLRPAKTLTQLFAPPSPATRESAFGTVWTVWRPCASVDRAAAALSVLQSVALRCRSRAVPRAARAATPRPWLPEYPRDRFGY